MTVLNQTIRDVKNVGKYVCGSGSISELPRYISELTASQVSPRIIVLLDEFFATQVHDLCLDGYEVHVVTTDKEPTTEYVDQLNKQINADKQNKPSLFVGIGGGSTLDITKALSNLATNPGKASDYQGWDLVLNPSVPKIAVPTISGTGAEATRTCVMTNQDNGIKLGMNSDHSIFDAVILDPDFLISVPHNQYFFTGMDTFIHSFEVLNGRYRNAIGDGLSIAAISMIEDIFDSEDYRTIDNRQKLMTAAYLGGMAIATSYVGLVHPISAALSLHLGTRHCVANCIVMRGMSEFYPKQYDSFWGWVEKHGIDVPQLHLTESQAGEIYSSSLMHTKPLTNAFGETFRQTYNQEVGLRTILKL